MSVFLAIDIGITGAIARLDAEKRLIGVAGLLREARREGGAA